MHVHLATIQDSIREVNTGQGHQDKSLTELPPTEEGANSKPARKVTLPLHDFFNIRIPQTVIDWLSISLDSRGEGEDREGVRGEEKGRGVVPLFPGALPTHCIDGRFEMLSSNVACFQNKGKIGSMK